MTDRRPTLAVVGATGAVGSALLKVLSVRADIWGEVRLLATRASAGRKLVVRGEDVTVHSLTKKSLRGVDIAVFHVPAEVARQWVPVAAAEGAVVLDGSAAFRMDPEVPLVVPQVNAEALRDRPRGIVASPGCSTLTLLDALEALHERWTLRELVVASYQAASGAGQRGVDRLHDEMGAVAGDRGLGTVAGDVRRTVEDKLGGRPSPFAAPLALNVVPWTGVHAQEGWTSEELEIRDEVRKVLDSPELRVSATCVQVPVVTTHSLAVHATFDEAVDVDEARHALVQAPSVVVMDNPEAPDFPTPADAAGADPTFVGRVRQGLDAPESLEMFVCADNLRKGAALNTVQTAELVAAELTA